MSALSRKTKRRDKCKTKFNSAELLSLKGAGEGRRCGSEIGGAPLVHGAGFAAVGAQGGGEMFAAIRTDSVGFESIQAGEAFMADPEGANDRMFVTGWAGEALATRQFREFRKEARLHQAAPAAEQNEDHHEPEHALAGDRGDDSQKPDPDKANNDDDH